jgi:uncharacterized protein (DUF427 family)
MQAIIASILTVSSISFAGEASELTVAETELKNAAWYYPNPKDQAKNIKDYVAFCRSEKSLPSP